MLKKLIALGVLALTVAGCADVDMATRNAPMETAPLAASATVAAPRDYRLADIRFAVPENLSVSEANSYYPIADIVWRGDPHGDRGQQIAAMFDSAARAAAQGINGSTPVILDITLVRFHGVTERTRYTVGGVHAIRFDLTVLDARNGAILEPTRRVDADLRALGGMEAIRADQQGQTQKVRVTAHLTALFRDSVLRGLPAGVTAAAGS